jgi:structure-specific recognition protein 1
MANQGVAWKALDGEGQVAIPHADIKWAEWIRVARNFQLRIGLSLSKNPGKDAERMRETFDGFQRDDQEKVAKLLKQLYSITLEVRDMTFKGWNWGATDFRGACSYSFQLSSQIFIPWRRPRFGILGDQ